MTMPEDPVICRSASRFFGGHKTSHRPICVRHRLSVPRHAERCHDPVEREIRTAPPHIGLDEERRRYHLTARLRPRYKLVIRKMHEAAKWTATYQRGKIYRFFTWPAAADMEYLEWWRLLRS